MNVVSFSIYGTNLKYYKGALENAKLCPSIYPNWECRYYVNDTVDPLFVNVLKKIKHVNVIHIKETRGPTHGMYWRCLVNDDPNVNKYIIRDADSRLNTKEQAAVKAWIDSGKSFHVMKDCIGHNRNIQGCAWGGTANKINISNLIDKHAIYEKWGDDEDFLSNVWWPLIKDDCLIHDPFYAKIPYPDHTPINGFIGERYDEYNNPLP